MLAVKLSKSDAVGLHAMSRKGVTGPSVRIKRARAPSRPPSRPRSRPASAVGSKGNGPARLPALPPALPQPWPPSRPASAVASLPPCLSPPSALYQTRPPSFVGARVHVGRQRRRSGTDVDRSQLSTRRERAHLIPRKGIVPVVHRPATRSKALVALSALSISAASPCATAIVRTDQSASGTRPIWK